MAKNRLVMSILVCTLAVGVIGTVPVFGIWPFSSSEEENAQININTANQETLAVLPGVGEANAKAIIEYRQMHGPFKTVEEVKKVPGIEEQMFASIKAKITVGEQEQTSLQEPAAQRQTKMTAGEDEK